MSTELEEMVMATAELMQTRRQELFDVIRKRAAQGTGVVPPPKRIALTPIRPDMLNMIYLRGDGKKKMMKQLQQQQQQQQVPPPPPATLAPPTPQRTPHTMGEDEEVAPTAVAAANLPYACETECSPSPEIADRSCLPGSPAQPKKTPEGAKWWTQENIEEQLQKQENISPSAYFEPRLSPINADAIFKRIRRD